MGDFGGDVPEADLTLRSFGTTAFFCAEGGRVPGVGEKALGLSVYVADAGGAPVTRETLADVLWGRSDRDKGLTNVRQTLTRLKKGLGPVRYEATFDVNDRDVAFRPAEAFDGAALAAAAGLGGVRAAAAAAEIYTGAFLADLHPDEDRFVAWADDKRRHYEALALEAFQGTVAAAVSAERWADARRAAQRIIDIDEFDETAHEALVRAYVAEGARAQAHRHFERLRKSMLSELGVEPGFRLAELEAPGGPRLIAPRPAPPPPVAEVRPTIAVLNATESGDDEQAALASGVVEELVSNLSRSIWINVSALEPTLGPRGAGVATAPKELSGAVDYVLRVKLTLAGPRVKILATLSRLSDNLTLFSDPMEDRAEDVLALQSRVARRIASIFVEKVVGDQAETAPAVAPEAEPVDAAQWRRVMRARWLHGRMREATNREAAALLDEALAFAPSDVAALGLSALTHLTDALEGWSPDVADSLEKARALGARATEAAPDSPWAHMVLGVASVGAESAARAHARLRHALRLDPGLTAAMGFLGRVEVYLGDLESGVRRLDHALAESPYDPLTGVWLRAKAAAAYMAGDLDAAAELVDYVSIVRPGALHTLILEAAVAAARDRPEDASRAMARVRRRAPDFPAASLRFAFPFEKDVYARFRADLSSVDPGFAPD